MMIRGLHISKVPTVVVSQWPVTHVPQSSDDIGMEQAAPDQASEAWISACLIVSITGWGSLPPFS